MPRPPGRFLRKKHPNTDTDPETDVDHKHFRIHNFSAATDTSRITLLWQFIYMTRNPDSQKKIQEEIDNVIGMFQFYSKLFRKGCCNN